MKALYQLAGISKQGHYKSVSRERKQHYQEVELVNLAKQVRLDHKRMGMRTLYDKLQPKCIGRDRFVEVLRRNGMQIQRVRSFKRTTFAHPSSRYPNLLSGKELDDTNQAWVSDITYVRVKERFYYLTMILDVYSRRIVGWSLSKTLEAESNMKALRMALRCRKGANLEGLIHHSDRGSQYVFKPYLKLLKSKGVEVSMGEKAWENAHAERINGIIKLDYIQPFHPKSWEQLKKVTKKAIKLYNCERPHSSIRKSTPLAFEKQIENIPIDKRDKYLINY